MRNSDSSLVAFKVQNQTFLQTENNSFHIHVDLEIGVTILQSHLAISIKSKACPVALCFQSYSALVHNCAKLSEVLDKMLGLEVYVTMLN